MEGQRKRKKEGKEKERKGKFRRQTQGGKPHEDKSRVSEIIYYPNQARFMIVALSCPNLY